MENTPEEGMEAKRKEGGKLTGRLRKVERRLSALERALLVKRIIKKNEIMLS